MKIYYNLTSGKWEHQEQGEFTWGSNQQLVEKINQPQRNSISFKINCNNGKLGPLIGIMAGRNQNHSIVGNARLFKKLQEIIMSYHGLSIVFTPENIKSQQINGVLFVPNKDKWVKVKAPLPDLVYNRVPFRKMEKSIFFQRAVQLFQANNIPFFNPCFLDKFQMFSLFKYHPKLKQFFPHTELIQDDTQLFDFLKNFKSVYLKPTSSAKGKGIYQLSLLNDQTISLKGMKEQYTFINFSDFWNMFAPILATCPYLVQTEVISAKINNHRFDFRVLAHFDQEEYKVTGVAIRKSEKQEITTHVPNGGIIYPYKEIQTKEHDQFFNMIVKELGSYLSKKIGFFGEFSIDAGIDHYGNYVIYEVNSKPMSFDEEHIEEARYKNLCNLFLQLTGFEWKK